MMNMVKSRLIKVALLTTTLSCFASLNHAFADSKTDFYSDPTIEEKYNSLVESKSHKALVRIQPTNIKSMPKVSRSGVVNTDKIHVKKIDIQGVVSGSSEEIQKLIQPMIGSYINVGSIAQKLTEYYQDQGLLLSKAYVPRQSFANGVVKIHVIEGAIREVIVVGDINSKVFNGYVDKLLMLGTVRKKELVRYLLLMNKIPGYNVEYAFEPVSDDQINISNGKVADLVLVVNRSHSNLAVNVDNYGSEDLGRYEGTVAGQLLSPFNKDESIFGFVGTTNKPDKLKVATVGFTKSVNSEGTYVKAMGQYVTNAADNTSNPSSGTSSNKNDSGTLFKAKIAHYPILTNKSSVRLDVGLQNRTQKTFNNTAPQSHYHITSAYIGTAIEHKDSFGAYNKFRPMVYQAISGLSKVTMDDSSLAQYSNNYTLFTALLERDQPLVGDTSLYLSANGQYTSSNLPIEEQFGVGGMVNGRAYPLALVSVSKGFGATAEFRYTKNIDNKVVNAVQPYAFYEVSGFPKSQASTDVSSLGSVGAGARFMFNKGINLSLEVGSPLTKNINISNVATKNNTKYSIALSKGFEW